MNRELIYLGLFKFPFGYGEAAKGYKEASSRLKLPMKFIDISSPEGWKELRTINLYDRTVIFHKRPMDEYSESQRLAVNNIGRKVFMTVWECDKAPRQWNCELVDADIIITPSTFSSNSVKSTFPGRQYYELPHYIRKPHKKLARVPEIKPDKINILYTNSQLTSRKGIDLALSGYYSLPRDIHKNTRLIVKGVKGTVDFCKKFMVDHNKPEVVVIEDYLTDEEMDNLFFSCDIFFSPNRGEGFGLDIVKSWLLGIPLAITDIGGYTDVLKLEMARTNIFFIQSMWDYAYCKATYHDTDVHRLKWPTPTLISVVDVLEKAIRFVTNTGKEKGVSVENIGSTFDKYNKYVDQMFAGVINKIADETSTYEPKFYPADKKTPYLLMTGGLGDVVNSVYATNIWAYLNDISEKYILVLFTHNPHSKDVFKDHPNIDNIDIREVPWMDKVSVDNIVSAARLNPSLIMNKQIEWKKQKGFEIPLTDDDRKLYDKITSVEKYAVIQPYSGDKSKDIPVDVFVNIVHDLRGLGYTTDEILIVGKNYSRKAEEGNEIHAEETVPNHISKDVSNLVDKTSISLSCRLIGNSKLFVGTHSVGAMVAWHKNIPNIILYNEIHKTKYFKSPGNWSFGMLNPTTKHGLFSDYNSTMLAEALR